MEAIAKQYDQFMENAEFNRFGIMALLLLINTGFGSIVVLNIMESTKALFPLMLCAFATTIPNVFGLAVSPMKWIVWGNIVGMSVNLLLLIFAIL